MDNSYNVAMKNPILQVANPQYPPNTTRLTLEQEYNRLINQMAPPQNQSNAYNDYLTTLNSCSDVTRNRILSDERFAAIYGQCELYLKEYLYAQALPYILETQQGRKAFEQLYVVTKSLKDEYNQRDMQKERQIELLMQDEIVLQRLQELQNNQSQVPAQSQQQVPKKQNFKNRGNQQNPQETPQTEVNNQ